MLRWGLVSVMLGRAALNNMLAGTGGGYEGKHGACIEVLDVANDLSFVWKDRPENSHNANYHMQMKHA